MTHSRRVLLVLGISLIISASCAYLLLDARWLQDIIPAAIDTGGGRFGVFATLFIFIFDFLVLVVEQPGKE